ncbi:hypothetical protein GCM10009557_25430 [Virgisporangium ochraceum]|uniref:Uncharacterized protein n=1 Tax=Virgisporangium ochraceum TaxID=65505 RepID=A0A8J4EC70_9ACTN|nr:hypothetical protein Voc01_014840 [Virgisporangium ochraceum]
MPRRRLVVALLFTAAGITPLAALGAAWGDQTGWMTSTSAAASGQAAETFPAKAPAVAAPVPELIQPPATPVNGAAQTVPTVTSTAAAPTAPPATKKPAGPQTARPIPTATATTTPPAPEPTGTPSEAPTTAG